MIAGYFLSGCKKSTAYSDIPEIHFQKLEIKDTIDDLGTAKVCVLYFSFIDGNGDLGDRAIGDIQTGTSSFYTYWFQKFPDGTYQLHRFNDDTYTKKSIPYEDVMNKDNAYNKVLKGTATAVLVMPQNVPGMDTVCLEFYIADRAANKSNLEKTPDFSLLKDTVLLAK